MAFERSRVTKSKVTPPSLSIAEALLARPVPTGTYALVVESVEPRAVFGKPGLSFVFVAIDLADPEVQRRFRWERAYETPDLGAVIEALVVRGEPVDTSAELKPEMFVGREFVADVATDLRNGRYEALVVPAEVSSDAK